MKRLWREDCLTWRHTRNCELWEEHAMKWSSYNAPFFLFFFFLFYGKNMEHHTWKIKGGIKRIWVATCTGGSTDTLLRLHSSRQAQTDFWWRARTIVKARNTSGCTFMEQHIPWWISSYNTTGKMVQHAIGWRRLRGSH